MNDKVKRYLTRIGFDAAPTLSRETLDTLQTLHYQSVPYENLDILAGKLLSFEVDDLYAKVVDHRRGGYCFELNALYAWLLSELGFTVRDFMARFLLNEPAIPMRRHRVLVVELNGQRLLCDVGVGLETPRTTVLLEEGLIHEEEFGTYKMQRDPFLGWVLYEQYNGEWLKLYSFTGEPQLPIDYIMPSFYCERHPDSIFNKAPMLAIRTKTGRRTLDGDVFKTHTLTGATQTTAATPEEYAALMQAYFGIAI
jgi:N-hydroxyarylamine O-acetyltransferase